MRFTIPADVVARDLDGEAVLLHLASGIYYGLDPVGTRIWHLLAEHHATEPIVPLLLEEFEIDAAQLRADLDGLFAQLLEHRLLIAADADE